MVDKRIIEQVLAEQYEELVALQDIDLCTRKEEDEINLDSHLAQVVIGVRRSGKSTLCYNALKSPKKRQVVIITDFHREELTMEGKLVQIIPAYNWLIK